MVIVVLVLLVITAFVSFKWHQERKSRRRLENILRSGEVRTQPEEATGLLTDDFISVLSHELRTPLTPILGAAYMLRSDPQDTKIFQRSLDLIERNAKAQAKIVEDLLDVSRILSGKLRLNMETVELRGVVEQAVEMARPASEAKNIEFRANLQPLSGVVSGDSTRLLQVIANLLSNAIKFTPKGGRIFVELSERDSAAEVRIVDSGIGIGPEFLPYVFERFRQADTARRRAVGGLGLGLSIVRHLVESHGGAVQAESAGVQQGATFTVRLPLRPVAQQAMRVHAGR